MVNCPQCHNGMELKVDTNQKTDWWCETCDCYYYSKKEK